MDNGNSRSTLTNSTIRSQTMTTIRVHHIHRQMFHNVGSFHRPVDIRRWVVDVEMFRNY
jgi:hypothetical protein